MREHPVENFRLDMGPYRTGALFVRDRLGCIPKNWCVAGIPGAVAILGVARGAPCLTRPAGGNIAEIFDRNDDAQIKTFFAGWRDNIDRCLAAEKLRHRIQWPHRGR